MRGIFFFICNILFSLIVSAQKQSLSLPKSTLCFTENKGQVSDQYNHPRPDVLFSGSSEGLVFHLKNNGVSYQLSKTENLKEVEMKGEKRKVPDRTTVYRVDVNWLSNNNSPKIKKGEALSGYTNYYFEVCPDGIHHVKSYSDITYENIYEGIDLKWYSKDNRLKYDYLISAGADYKAIQFEIKGAEKISVNEKGELQISTPLGNIIEEAPLVKQNNRVLKSEWIVNGTTISFNIENLNPTEPFVIDPQLRAWGTFYGGTAPDVSQACCVDFSGNPYIAGYTQSGAAIATVGSHQSVYGGNTDAFLAKFNTNGTRIWATYYGGSDWDNGYSCATDLTGNVYLAGESTSTLAIASIGSHQSVYGGGSYDGFLAKFDSTGVRQWGTYYGGNNDDNGYACSTDPIGNVYLTGFTSTTINVTSIATPGSYMPSPADNTNAFLVKFNSGGVRLWGTFYGGIGSDVGYSCTTDLLGYVYVAGATTSSIGTIISTPGTHQPSYAGSMDAFLVKFDGSGARQWGTYYGGTGTEYGYCCATDLSGNIYLGGRTSSTSGTAIATPGSHQPVFGGGTTDAFLVKFNSNALRLWGTYYGGNGNTDYAFSCTSDKRRDVYIAGQTSSSVGIAIASPNGHQPVFGGFQYDSFFTRFDSTGVRIAGTYYGSIFDDWAYSCAVDTACNSFLAGGTAPYTTTAIAIDGSYQPSAGGVQGSDGYLVKFWACPPFSPINTTAAASQTVCTGGTTSLCANGTGTLNWYATPASTVILGTGNTFYTPTLSVGVYTYYVEAFTCVSSLSRTPVTLTVMSLPPVNINASDTVICTGENVTLNANGADAYSWSNNQNLNSISVSPTVTTSYTVTGTNTLTGCQQTASITIQVNLCTGINNLAQNPNAYIIRPNPNNGEFEISIKSGLLNSIEIYDMLGRIVRSLTNLPNEVKINIKELPNGIYYLKVRTNDACYLDKIIKE